MGQSTDGQISFGILFEEEFEFPWDAQPYDGDIDEWWLIEVLKYKPSFEIYNDDGGYIDGKEDRAKTDKYYEERSAFEDTNPKCPVTLVNYCSGNCPMYIVALEETVLTANRGGPEIFDPTKLVVTPEQIKTLTDFFITNKIETDSNPSWYLSSDWS